MNEQTRPFFLIVIDEDRDMFSPNAPVTPISGLASCRTVHPQSITTASCGPSRPDRDVAPTMGRSRASNDPKFIGKRHSSTHQSCGGQ